MAEYVATPMEIEKPSFRPMTNNQSKQFISDYWTKYIQICVGTPSLCRRPPISSDVTELMVKLCLEKYGYNVIWTKNEKQKRPGDIYVNNKRVEIKAYTSNAGIGFRKVQNWDVLCLVDCRAYHDKIFSMYIINLSNTSDTFQSLPATKTESIRDKWNANNDARINSDNLLQNIDSQYIEMFFNDHIDVLLNT